MTRSLTLSSRTGQLCKRTFTSIIMAGRTKDSAGFWCLQISTMDALRRRSHCYRTAMERLGDSIDFR